MSHTSIVKSEQAKGSPGKKGKRGSGRKVNFKVKACPDSVVCIAGSFNQWDPVSNRMEPDGDGCYITSLLLPVGRHEYKYVVDGAWCLDPECPQCVSNAFGSQNHVIEIY